MPKMCGHFADKSVVSKEEATSRIKEEVDARHSEDFLIIGHTDARAVEGLEAALERAQLFIDRGADLTFVEEPLNVQELGLISQALSVPQVVNGVICGKTPTLDAQEFARMGFGLVTAARQRPGRHLRPAPASGEKERLEAIALTYKRSSLEGSARHQLHQLRISRSMGSLKEPMTKASNPSRSASIAWSMIWSTALW